MDPRSLQKRRITTLPKVRHWGFFVSLRGKGLTSLADLDQNHIDTRTQRMETPALPRIPHDRSPSWYHQTLVTGLPKWW